jgi:CheY-specific phosphatase CheX
VEREDPFRLAVDAAPTVAGVVQITGAWEGAVGLQCAEPLARQAAMKMFAVPAPAVTPADLRDALGELGNMMGGNFKALLPEPCVLSLPMVIEGRDFRLSLPGTAQVLQAAFRSGEQPFCVTVLQRVGNRE